MTTSSFVVLTSNNEINYHKANPKEVLSRSNCCCEMFVTIEKDEFGNKHRVIKCRNYSYEDVVFAKCVFTHPRPAALSFIRCTNAEMLPER